VDDIDDAAVVVSVETPIVVPETDALITTHVT